MSYFRRHLFRAKAVPRRRPHGEAERQEYQDLGLTKAGEPKPVPRTPHQGLRDLASSYMQQKGMAPHADTETTVRANPDRAKRIADAYHAMPHDPSHPDVQRAYKALADETLDQYRHIKAAGYRFTPIKPGQENPYAAGSKAMLEDLHNNKHLYYYPTDQGFGSSSHDSSDHPLMADSGEKAADGKPMLHNDVFRVVHDVFGHGKEGFSFGPHGEENAWLHHMQMYSPDARRALTSETRGQNSWVNFGPYGEQNRKDPANTVYADQKAGLLPDWVLEDHDAAQKKSEKESGAVKPTNPLHLTLASIVDNLRHAMTHGERFTADPASGGGNQADHEKFMHHMREANRIHKEGHAAGLKLPSLSEIQHRVRHRMGLSSWLADRVADSQNWQGSPTPTSPTPKDVTAAQPVAIQKKSELAKGSLQRRTPYNPKDVPEEHQAPVSRWTESGYDGGRTEEDRQAIPRMEGNLRTRAIHKLHGLTQARRNPKTGEREFLLHRGMREEEHGRHVKGQHATYAGNMTWSANPEIAYDFGSEGNWPTKEGYKPRIHRVSAWVPESKIHHVPMMLGQLGGDLERLGGGELQRRNEHEVISAPGQYEVHSVSPIEPQKPQGLDDYKPRPFGKSEYFRSLKKGAKGDWKKEGYTIQHRREVQNPGTPDERVHYHLSAYDRHGNNVGSTLLSDYGGGLVPFHTEIDPDHRRKGLATALYTHAEKVAGIPVEPADEQSDDAESLWSQPNRPFGKSEYFRSLKKGAKGDWKKEGYEIGSHWADEDKPTRHLITYMKAPADQSGRRRSVGHVIHTPDGQSWGSFVDHDHRRKGIATALQAHAEKKLGVTVRPSDALLPDGKKLWSQPNRPFGKSEYFRKLRKELIPGGKASGRKPSEFDQDQLEAGTKVEMEHTDDPRKAREIAMDHLAEDPRYYEKLKEVHLEKGARGDWEKEGYRLGHTNPDDYCEDCAVHGDTEMRVHVTDPSGQEVAHAHIKGGHPSHDKLYPSGVSVHPQHRRKGIATAMYRYAEQHYKKPIERGMAQTDDAEALWSQPNRPFGKAERYFSSLKKSSELKKPAPYLQEDYEEGTLGDLQMMPRSPGMTLHSKRTLPNGLEHRVYTDHQPGSVENTYHHEIRDPKSKSRSPLSYVSVFTNEYEPDQFRNEVHHSGVDPKHKGKGLGRIAYAAALEHHGQLHSDSLVSPMAHEAWKHLGRHVFTELAPYDEHSEEYRHLAIWGPRGNKLYHKVQLNAPAGHRLKSAKKPKKKGKRLAASELVKAPLDDKALGSLKRWVRSGSNPELREQAYQGSMSGLSDAEHKAMLDDLAQRTDVREGSGGEREFLLHRGMSSTEMPIDQATLSHQGVSSWTPTKGVAHAFVQGRPNSHVVSAWVPQRHIGVYVPHVYDTHGPKLSNARRMEHEVVVGGPGAFSVHGTESAKPKKGKRLAASEDQKLAKAPLSDDQIGWAEQWKEGYGGRDELHESMMHPSHDADRRKMLAGLATATKTKKVGGVRHFLLHRGHPEDDAPHYEGEVASWTTKPSVAEAFANQYGGRVTSEWVPEHHISYSFDHSHKARSKGSLPPMNTGRSLGGEAEVVVGPSRASYEMGHVRSFLPEDHPEKILGKPTPTKPKKSLAALKRKTKKSELAKAPYVDERNIIAAENVGPYRSRNSTAKLVGTYKHKGHVVHHYQDDDMHDFVVHQDYDPKKPALSSVNVGPSSYEEDEYAPAVHHAATHPAHQGEGMGTAAYVTAIKTLGNLRSSRAMSPLSDKAWRSIKEPGIKIKYGRGEESSHEATYTPPKTRKKSLASLKSKKKGKKLAASELEKTLTHEDAERHFRQHGLGQTSQAGMKGFSPKPGHTPSGLPHGSYVERDLDPQLLWRGSEGTQHSSKQLSEEDEPWAQKYAQMPPSTSPAIIVKPHPDKPGHWQILDGAHRARAAHINGLKSIKALVHSSGSKLEKGSWQSKNPVAPSKMDSDAAEKWVANLSDTRDQIPRSTGAERLRSLSRLAAATQTRKNPKTGEHEFLLHRGHGPRDPVMPGRSKKRTGWTPRLQLAQLFGEHGPHMSGTGVVTSAWIPESAIVSSLKHTKLSPDMYARAAREHEVIVEPHKYQVHQQRYAHQVPKEETRGQKPDLQARFKAYMEAKRPKKLAASELEKGSWQSKNPIPNSEFDQQNVPNSLTEWVRGAKQYDRQEIPKSKGPERLRSLSRLAAATQVRKNPKTGEHEFLLHRGHGPLDPAVGGGSSRTSWTPKLSLAHKFAAYAGHQKGTGTVTSAWIPASKIVSVPKHSGRRAVWETGYGSEHEVVVAPHKYQVHKQRYAGQIPMAELIDQKKPDLQARFKAYMEAKRPKKLAASELAKAPYDAFDDEDHQERWEAQQSLTPTGKGAEPERVQVRSEKVGELHGEDLYHHHIRHDADRHQHMLSKNPDPWGQAISILEGQNAGSGIQVLSSLTHGDYRGMGLGTQLYGHVARRHGRIISDNSLSEGSDAVYRKMKGSPHFKVKLGRKGTREPHVVEYVGDGNGDKDKEVSKPRKKSLAVLKPKKGKRLAASELAKRSELEKDIGGLKFKGYPKVSTRPQEEVREINPKTKRLQSAVLRNKIVQDVKAMNPRPMTPPADYDQQLILQARGMGRNFTHRHIDEAHPGAGVTLQAEANTAGGRKFGRPFAIYHPSTDVNEGNAQPHEAIHYQLRDLREKYGNHAYQDAVKQLSALHHPDDYSALAQWMKESGAATPENVDEEMVAYADTIARNPAYAREMGINVDHKRVKANFRRMQQLSRRLKSPYAKSERSPFKKSELAKAKRKRQPGWVEGGYTFQIHPKEPKIGEPFKVTAHIDGYQVGHAHMLHDSGRIHPIDVEVEHKREGLATAMYDLAEAHLGSSVVPSDRQSPDAEKFWRSRDRRPLSEANKARQFVLNRYQQSVKSELAKAAPKLPKLPKPKVEPMPSDARTNPRFQNFKQVPGRAVGVKGPNAGRSFHLFDAPHDPDQKILAQKTGGPAAFNDFGARSTKAIFNDRFARVVGPQTAKRIEAGKQSGPVHEMFVATKPVGSKLRERNSAQPRVIDGNKHSHPHIGKKPGRKSLHHGVDLSNGQVLNTGSITDSEGKYLGRHKNHKQQDVFVKEGLDPESLADMGFQNPQLSTAHREAIYHNMAHDFFGLGQHVPETTTFTHGGKHYSAMEWKGDHKPHGWDYGGRTPQSAHLKEMLKTGELHKVALMNLIMGNTDRHSGNFLTKKGKLALIDNGFTLDYNNDQGRAFQAAYLPSRNMPGGYEATAVPEHVRQWLHKLSPVKLASQLRANGVDAKTVKAAVQRLQQVKELSHDHESVFDIADRIHGND